MFVDYQTCKPKKKKKLFNVGLSYCLTCSLQPKVVHTWKIYPYFLLGKGFFDIQVYDFTPSSHEKCIWGSPSSGDVDLRQSIDKGWDMSCRLLVRSSLGSLVFSLGRSLKGAFHRMGKYQIVLTRIEPVPTEFTM